MIHEELVRLWHSLENSNNALNVNQLQEFLHPGEQGLLKHIYELATTYHWIVNFCNQLLDKSNHNASRSEVAIELIPQGLYMKACANGVLDVLQTYKNETLELEEKFLENPQLSLTYISSCLEKYRSLFEFLKSIIQEMQVDHSHGCLLLGMLHKYLHFGVDLVVQPAEKITKSINFIFYRHLCNWIIYGDLVDVHNEFFICDGNCDDQDFVVPEQLNESHPSTVKKSRIKRPPPIRKFFINWNRVPTFMNEDTVESILFMGRIVRIIRNEPKTPCEEHYQTKYRRDVWDGKDIEYYEKVEALKNHWFDEKKFEFAIEECRIKLTKYLWLVMLEEGNLKEHLHLIRDYYILGRGELFHQFIAVTENPANGPPLEHNAHNLNFIFMETAKKIYGENDKTYLRFELATSTSDVSILAANLWTSLQLNFEMKWPLHIIFHPKSIELYNKLFTYLLKLKKTQIHLSKLWQLHVSEQKNRDRKIWALRQHLMFLVNNLQYYFQVDVIEAQFSILLKAIENASEFEDILKVHHEFISNLLAKTFVLMPDEKHIYKNKHKLHQMPAVQFNVPSKVHNIIVDLLELCDAFCLVASTWDGDLTEPELAELAEFQKRTDTIVETLLFILYKLHEKTKGRHILQLLYQLDYNCYFSRTQANFNVSVGAQ